VTPPGTRLILASEDLFTMFGTRTEDGRKITAEWGDPTSDGWYTPIFTATDDGKRLVSEAELATALENVWTAGSDSELTFVAAPHPLLAGRVFAALVAAQEKGETGS
jgi:secreted protein with Ig-like and vWFA domain